MHSTRENTTPSYTDRRMSARLLVSDMPCHDAEAFVSRKGARSPPGDAYGR
jgi:hypothetical protein